LIHDCNVVALSVSELGITPGSMQKGSAQAGLATLLMDVGLAVNATLSEVLAAPKDLLWAEFQKRRVQRHELSRRHGPQPTT